MARGVVVVERDVKGVRDERLSNREKLSGFTQQQVIKGLIGEGDIKFYFQLIATTVQ